MCKKINEYCTSATSQNGIGIRTSLRQSSNLPQSTVRLFRIILDGIDVDENMECFESQC